MVYTWPAEVLEHVETGQCSALEACRALIDLDRMGSSIRKHKSKNETAPVVTENIFKDLDQLIGLEEVKKLVREIYAFIEIQKRRQKEQLLTEPLCLHMIFKGNPGTGKTTVARILGKIFYHMKLLEKGHLIEVERADLVGEYIGHTAQKTREQLKRAYGGILFIDEAYSLSRGGEKDFGKEAIDCIVILRKQISIKVIKENPGTWVDGMVNYLK
ncbi:stage V sporulation protein K [Sporomusaceae bacterium BoRhaA]|uniref:AAA family ATPase n=1 Tax=Pelorhabdus rhamnosifermentans TaxID=2772457 RepID=UPI001C0635CA|nr:AAA family ATPase [Pelorhabdus rhamnosifermentans]MBU2701909.1 stage V sporulation protein K [Pelorhabdus rhamnosifermentans]